VRIHAIAMALGLLAGAAPAGAQSGEDVPAGAMAHDHVAADTAPADAWRMPPMPVAMPMVAELSDARPKVGGFLPYVGIDPERFPEAAFRQIVPLEDGDTLALEAMPVRRRLKDRTLVMYGFNGQYPGPLIRVDEDAEIVVEFTNSIDLPTTIHWHGVRIENRFDGVPGVTQELVQPGGSFTYRIRFPDAGIYWYHPHHREDVTQDLGLYGNMLVDSPEDDYWGPVNREEVVMLDDILIDGRGIFPYGDSTSSHALMGRFGNVLLVNGEPEYRTTVARGGVVRFFLTNVANTRMFNLVFEGGETKLVGADIGRFEREVPVESVVVAPAQRYVAEVRYERPGTYPITNSIQAIDHFWGTFYPRVDTLGFVEVTDEPADPDHGSAFETLRRNPDVSEEIDRYRRHFDGPPDHELELTVEVEGLNRTIVQIMALDTLFFPPVEWNDVMPMMNWISSGADVRWVVRDPATGRENMEIDWRFDVGDVVKLRITNDARSFHPMQHPIHLHGQRFLVVARDGAPSENLAWKDTVVIPVGATFDLVVEMSNPGDWMLHCHIAEHLEAGMKTVFRVEGEDRVR